jgi:hypothetical protein
LTAKIKYLLTECNVSNKTEAGVKILHVQTALHRNPPNISPAEQLHGRLTSINIQDK